MTETTRNPNLGVGQTIPKDPTSEPIMPVSSPDDFEKKYWFWLNREYTDKLNQIRKSVEKLFSTYEKIFPQLAGYTPHGPEHLARVENLIHRLIPGKTVESLSMKERFYLLAGAWVHDVGMLRGLFGEEERNLTKYPDDKIRREHHKRAEKFLTNQFPRMDVDEEDANVLGLLSRYHRRSSNILSCPVELYVNNESIRVRLLAAYLRLADSLDIDQSRTPSSDYAICISYNIPITSKLHWIKSRLVSGISIKAESQKIIIHFKEPHQSDLIEEINKLNITASDTRILRQNIVGLRKLIIDDLAEELNSVKNVLIRGNISYFLDIEQCVSQMVIDEHIFRELIHLANNFDMITHPSATRLMSMVLETFERILSGFRDYNDENNECAQANFQEFNDDSILCNQELKPLRQKLHEFLDELECQVLQTRSCHTGLKSLVDRLKSLLQNNSISNIQNGIQVEKTLIEQERNNIRNISRKYFYNYLTSNKFTQPSIENNEEESNENSDTATLYMVVFNRFKNYISNLSKENKDYNGTPVFEKNILCINILVYGYSELVIKSICGFRDCIIDMLIKAYTELTERSLKFHKVDIEKIAASFLRIFVCEGQPKTITAPNDALTYHDGSRYANTLARRKFTNIVMLPDLAAGNILQRSLDNSAFRIDLVMIGANGLEFVSRLEQDKNSDITDNAECSPMNKFRHSSGHMAISSLTAHFKNYISKKETKSNGPRLVLVLGASKCVEKPYIKHSMKSNENNNENQCPKGNFVEKDGFKFWSHDINENVRNEPFIVRDKSIRKDFHDNDISLYNPREDIIPLKMVDDMIMDFKYFIGIRSDTNLRRFDLPEAIKEQIAKAEAFRNSK